MAKNNLNLVTITPEIASQYLQKNVNNRSYRERTAKYYADIIKRGDWEVNGETIKLAKDGRVLDGQHRLQAVILANEPIQSYVIEGLEDTTFDTIDVGLRRSPADALNIYTGGKCKSPSVISAALKIIDQFEKDDNEYKSFKRRERGITHSELIRVYDNNPDIQDNYDLIMTYSNILNFVPPSVCLALYTVMKRINEDQANRFWNSWNTGAGLSENSPINALRNRLTSYMAKNSGRKPHRRLIIAMVVKAWNARRSNKPLKNLKVNETDTIKMN